MVESGTWEVWAARKQREWIYEDVPKIREVALNLRLWYSPASAQSPDLFLSGSYTQVLAWKATKGHPRPAVMRDQLCTWLSVGASHPNPCAGQWLEEAATGIGKRWTKDLTLTRDSSWKEVMNGSDDQMSILFNSVAISHTWLFKFKLTIIK